MTLTADATSEVKSAAPGLRTTSPPSTAGISQTPATSALAPGSSAPMKSRSGELVAFQRMKTSPSATPNTAATTMSTTRQRQVEVRGAVAVVTMRALSVAVAGKKVARVGDRGCGRAPRMPPCAGMIRIRFDGRSLDQLPLSPAHRTPVFVPDHTLLDVPAPRCDFRADPA